MTKADIVLEELRRYKQTKYPISDEAIEYLMRGFMETEVWDLDDHDYDAISIEDSCFWCNGSGIDIEGNACEQCGADEEELAAGWTDEDGEPVCPCCGNDPNRQCIYEPLEQRKERKA